MPKNWKHYLPGIFSFGMAWIILMVPSIAVFIILSFLVTFGVLYIFVVYQLHKGLVNDFEFRSSNPDAPGFKDVTVHIIRRGKTFYHHDL